MVAGCAKIGGYGCSMATRVRTLCRKHVGAHCGECQVCVCAPCQVRSRRSTYPSRNTVENAPDGRWTSTSTSTSALRPSSARTVRSMYSVAQTSFACDPTVRTPQATRAARCCRARPSLNSWAGVSAASRTAGRDPFRVWTRSTRRNATTRASTVAGNWEEVEGWAREEAREGASLGDVWAGPPRRRWRAEVDMRVCVVADSGLAALPAARRPRVDPDQPRQNARQAHHATN